MKVCLHPRRMKTLCSGIFVGISNAIMNPAKRVVRIVKTLFVRRSVGELVRLVWTSLFVHEKQLVFYADLTRPTIAEVPIELAPHIRKGKAHDLELARQTHPYVWEFHCDQFDGVTDFFIYQENGDIINICWLYRPYDRNRLLQLSPDDCEVKFVFTQPLARGRGIYPAVSLFMQKYLREQRVRRLFACIVADNAPSIWSHEKVGFRPVGQLTYLKKFGIQLSRRFDTSGVT